MALQTDLAAYNRYCWYDGSLQDIGDWADLLHAHHPGVPIGLGEYGAGGSVQHQQDPPVRPEAKSHWHPEQYQALFHEAYARQIAQRPFLWGHSSGWPSIMPRRGAMKVIVRASMTKAW